WIVDVYLLVLSSLILVGGSLGDLLGRVRVFGTGVALFTLASIWCGLAPSVGQLIVARAVQGVGAALLARGGRATTTGVYPADQRGKAIGTWSSFTAMAIIAGPILGGALVQTISWRAVFFINVPFGAVVMWIIFARMPDIPAEERGRIDWLGTLLITIALGGITRALIEPPAQPGPPRTVSAPIRVVRLNLFIFRQPRVSTPPPPAAPLRPPAP